MPYNSVNYTIHRKNIHNVRMPKATYDRLQSNWFDSSYLGADDYGQKLLYPGLIVAVDAATYKYVPYNSAASYGTGSDTAVGVWDTFADVTMGDTDGSPLYHGKLIEAYCYVLGETVGTISSTVKSHLTDIKFI